MINLSFSKWKEEDFQSIAAVFSGFSTTLISDVLNREYAIGEPIKIQNEKIFIEKNLSFVGKAFVVKVVEGDNIMIHKALELIEKDEFLIVDGNGFKGRALMGELQVKFEDLFSDGVDLGIKISYAVQEKPLGLAHAFIVGERFVGDENVCLVLGDNILYGSELTERLKRSVEMVEKDKKAVVFGYWVKNPSAYGIVEFDENENVVGLEEKPESPKSNWAVIGLYFSCFWANKVPIRKRIIKKDLNIIFLRYFLYWAV